MMCLNEMESSRSGYDSSYIEKWHFDISLIKKKKKINQFQFSNTIQHFYVIFGCTELNNLDLNIILLSVQDCS